MKYVLFALLIMSSCKKSVPKTDVGVTARVTTDITNTYYQVILTFNTNVTASGKATVQWHISNNGIDKGPFSYTGNFLVNNNNSAGFVTTIAVTPGDQVQNVMILSMNSGGNYNYLF